MKKKLLRIIMPSEDTRPKEGKISKGGILIPPDIAYAEEWPQKCEKNGFYINLYFKYMKSDYEFFGTIRKTEDIYVTWIELYQNFNLFPNFYIDITPTFKVEEEVIKILKDLWQNEININSNVEETPKNIDTYRAYTIQNDGLIMSGIDFNLKLKTLNVSLNIMIKYAYHWFLKVIDSSRDEIKNFLTEYTLPNKNNINDILPRKINKI